MIVVYFTAQHNHKHKLIGVFPNTETAIKLMDRFEYWARESETDYVVAMTPVLDRDLEQLLANLQITPEMATIT